MLGETASIFLLAIPVTLGVVSLILLKYRTFPLYGAAVLVGKRPPVSIRLLAPVLWTLSLCDAPIGFVLLGTALTFTTPEVAIARFSTILPLFVVIQIMIFCILLGIFEFFLRRRTHSPSDADTLKGGTA